MKHVARVAFLQLKFSFWFGWLGKVLCAKAPKSCSRSLMVSTGQVGCLMEIVILPDLSETQKKHLRRVRRNYVPPPIEGMYDINKKYPDGIINIYVGNCDWENNFDFCLRKFILVVFHEIMHVLLGSTMDEYVPYAERVLAEILNNDK